jgi:hypothetical protein
MPFFLFFFYRCLSDFFVGIVLQGTCLPQTQLKSAINQHKLLTNPLKFDTLAEQMRAAVVELVDTLA